MREPVRTGFLVLDGFAMRRLCGSSGAARGPAASSGRTRGAGAGGAGRGGGGAGRGGGGAGRGGGGASSTWSRMPATGPEQEPVERAASPPTPAPTHRPAPR
nr:hypothetical protein A8713_032095 [Streptomyces sp. SAT1]